MPLPLPVRVAALAAAGLWCAGCGTNAPPPKVSVSPPAAVRGVTQTPRALPEPSGAKPLVELAGDCADSIAQQANESAAVAAAHIRDLATGQSRVGDGTIRQPGAIVTQPATSAEVAAPAPPVEQPPAPAPRLAATAPLRSPFVPQAAEFPSAGPLPHLPAVPNFDASPPPNNRAIVVSPPQRHAPPSAAAPPPAPPPASRAAPPAAIVRREMTPEIAQQAQ